MEIIEIGKVAKVMSSKRIFAKEYVADGIPFYRSKEVGELCRGQEVKTELFISESRYEEIKSKFEIPEKGDLLLTAVGSIGNTWIVDDRKFYYKDGNLTQIKPSEKLDVNFLNYFFKSSIFWNSISSNSTGTAYSALTISTLNKIKIPLPPLKTQQRIAGILDDAAALRDKTAQLLIEYDLLAQSVFLEMFGDPVINEKGWEIKLLSEVCTKITDGTHQGPKFKTEGIPFLLVSNIVNNEILFETKKFIDDEEYNKLTKNTKIELGDILYTSVGSYGNPAIVKDKRKFCFQRHIAHLKLNSEMINVVFLHAMMTSPLIKRQADRFAIGAAQKTLNLKTIRNFEIFHPPIQLQNQFAEKIALIEQQKALAKQELQESEDLFNCLLQQAFKGELV